MIAVDTNVLVRYLAQDDREQAASADALIQHATDVGEPLFVSDIVVCELVWVLGSCYKTPRPKIVSVLRELLRSRQLEFRDTNELTRALGAFAFGKGDFADYLIREHGRTAEHDTVATFDKALLKETGFVSP